MEPEELTLIRVQYSEPMTTDEENARQDIEKLAGEIERLNSQLTAANARIAELETEIKVIPFDFIRVACDVARNNGYAFDSVWAWLKKYGKDEPQ